MLSLCYHINTLYRLPIPKWHHCQETSTCYPSSMLFLVHSTGFWVVPRGWCSIRSLESSVVLRSCPVSCRPQPAVCGRSGCFKHWKIILIVSILKQFSIVGIFWSGIFSDSTDFLRILYLSKDLNSNLRSGQLSAYHSESLLSGYHPQSKCQVKRTNQSLESVLTFVVAQNPVSWS